MQERVFTIYYLESTNKVSFADITAKTTDEAIKILQEKNISVQVLKIMDFSILH
jgi:uncharacterized lipoprotein YehR (DUF1307 family)